MATSQTRRSRRRVVAPSTLPRPTNVEAVQDEPLAKAEPVASVHASTRAPGRRVPGVRAHHVLADYRYVRSDLMLVAGVSAVCTAFVVAMAFVL